MMAELGGNVTTYIRLVLDKETDGQTGPHTAVQVSLYNEYKVICICLITSIISD